MPPSRAPRQYIGLFTLTIFLLALLQPPAAQAGMIGTQVIVQQQQAETQRERLQVLLERSEIRKQLVQWGVDPAAAQERVAQLSDGEVAELADQLDELPAGAGLVNALVFVFLVLLVTDILGLTDIFPFVRGPDER